MLTSPRLCSCSRAAAPATPAAASALPPSIDVRPSIVGGADGAARWRGVVQGRGLETCKAPLRELRLVLQQRALFVLWLCAQYAYRSSFGVGEHTAGS